MDLARALDINSTSSTCL